MTNYINNDKNKYLNSCVKFIIKNINKVFLEKNFNFFLKRVKMIPKVNKIVLKKNRINAYIKKIGKTKNQKLFKQEIYNINIINKFMILVLTLSVKCSFIY